jgi:hypothetical protein
MLHPTLAPRRPPTRVRSLARDRGGHRDKRRRRSAHVRLRLCLRLGYWHTGGGRRLRRTIRPRRARQYRRRRALLRDERPRSLQPRTFPRKRQRALRRRGRRS